MKKDTQKTKVLFLMEQPDSDISANVFAFFPDLLYSSATGLYQCYAHLGQHSGCQLEYANKCLQATQEQYAALKIKLEGLGYDLEVLNEQLPAPIKEDAKHTAGPWTFEDMKQFNILDSNLELLAVLKPNVDRYIEHPEEMKANAALIASAPTLLKENEQLKAEIERLRKWAVETIDISQNLAHKRKEQVNVLREALRNALEELGGLLEESDNQFGRDNNGVYQEGKIILSQTETN